MYISIDIESDAIGCLLLDSSLWEIAMSEYGITDESFVNETHQHFFRQGVGFVEQNIAPDIMMFDRPTNNPTYFWDAMDRVVTSSQYDVIFTKLKKLEVARKAKIAMQKAIEQIEVMGIIPEIEPLLSQVEGIKTGLTDYANTGQLETLQDAQNEAEKYIMEGMHPLPLWGKYTIGDDAFQLHDGETMVLSGTTGTGKTALAAQWALTMALSGKRVLYVCTESVSREIYHRFVATMCGIPHYEAANSSINGAFFRMCAQRLHSYLNNNLFLHCLKRAKPKTDDIERKIQMIERRYGHVDALFIDYIQDIGYPDTMKRMNELQKIEAVIDKIHDMCLFHGIAGIYLSQLNRTGEKDGQPGNEQIKNASKIAEKAHIVSFLWRKKIGQNNEDDGFNDKKTIVEDCSQFYSTKCRNTKFFNLKLHWENTRYRIENDNTNNYPVFQKIFEILPEIRDPSYEPYDELYQPTVSHRSYAPNYNTIETFTPFTNYR